MTAIADLLGHIRAISEHVTSALRVDSEKPTLAGWGQFVEPNSPVFQIGPYGTAAALVLKQIAYPRSPVEQRIRTQLRAFWDERPRGKFFPQNVRLAFTVLALAKAVEPELIALRDAIANELRTRQLEDGSWSDSKTDTVGRPDATGWVVLAFKRAGGSDAATAKGADWLANRVQGSGRAQLLSPIGLAAAILAHPKPHSVSGLRARGLAFLEQNNVSREELISFFDYDEHEIGSATQRRDFLCFPAFYPLSILINGLAHGASFLEAIRLDAYRSGAIRRLNELCNTNAYKPPAARFSSTVDQAICALTYEQLAASETVSARANFVALYTWSRESILVHLVLPLLRVVAAAVTLSDPATVPQALQSFGIKVDWLLSFASAYRPIIQICAALLVVFLPGVPRKGWALLRKRLLER